LVDFKDKEGRKTYIVLDMVRAPYFDKNGVKKGAWSQEEDDKLREHIEKYGLWNWREIPKFAGS
jgi:myb proto-oncogene protein